MLVRRLEMLPVECVARGYLSGSGTVEYQRTGSIRDVALPPGLVEGSKLPSPVFTPSTKAEVGEHDEAIDFAAVVAAVGRRPRRRAAGADAGAVLAGGGDRGRRPGSILADTKFEFGLDGDVLVLGDEVLTPDSSRFWPASSWSPGSVQPSYDKQYVRDWLTASGWDRVSPPPELPDGRRRGDPRALRHRLRTADRPQVRLMRRTRSGSDPYPSGVSDGPALLLLHGARSPPAAV